MIKREAAKTISEMVSQFKVVFITDTNNLSGKTDLVNIVPWYNVGKLLAQF